MCSMHFDNWLMLDSPIQNNCSLFKRENWLKNIKFILKIVEIKKNIAKAISCKKKPRLIINILLYTYIFTKLKHTHTKKKKNYLPTTAGFFWKYFFSRERRDWFFIFSLFNLIAIENRSQFMEKKKLTGFRLAF